MEPRLKMAMPRYQQIAADIASKIADGHYRVGEKIYARSSLSSQYGVSAETARRAICVLADLEIVETAKGSGVTIKSSENAIRFVRQFDTIRTVSDIKQEILDSVERQKKEWTYFKECLLQFIDITDRFRSINPFLPFQIEITSQASHLGQSVSEINFWHHTAATIIAIRRGETLMMSPGPYATLREGDVFFFIGEEGVLDRVRSFIYPVK